MYQRILGRVAYQQLPKTIQQLHGYQPKPSLTDQSTPTSTTVVHRFHGQCLVKRGTNPIARLLATILRFPHTIDRTTISVELKKEGEERETWTRKFGHCATPLVSTQWRVNDRLYESLNPFTTLKFRLRATPERLHLDLDEVTVLGIPQPQLIAPQVIAMETEVQNKFNFYVQTSFPAIGLLIEYEGWLEPDPNNEQTTQQPT